MKRILLLAIFAALIFNFSWGQISFHPEEIKYKSLYQGFVTPPYKAKPTVYYTLLNGYMNKEFVQQELEQYAEKGIGGLLVFDIGIIGKKEFFPPQGAEFMSEEWLDNFSYLVKKADELGMSVELAAVSSWDMGGAWTKPEEAVLALFQEKTTVQGPQKLKIKLEYPELPKTAILDKNGNPVVSEEVAVLAIPVKKRQESYEFVYKLDGNPRLHNIDYVVLANCKNTNKDIAAGKNIFAKTFAVEVSTTDDKDTNFKIAYKGQLKANTKKQKFVLPKDTKAKFVRLKIFDGHNKNSDYVQLAEFHVYDTKGEDVVFRPHNKRFGGGMEVRFNSQLGTGSKWSAKNLNNDNFEGAEKSWISNGKPPILIEDINSVQVISDNLNAEGILEWNVPDGEWEIIRYVMSNTGERLKIPNPVSDGYATDHLSATATKNHINYLTERLTDKFGDLSKSPINNFYLPSYEVRGLLWTYDLPEQFKAYRNYDLIKYLPALNGYVIENEETTARFKYDFQRTMGDLLIDAFYITANNTAKEHGMAIKAESAGPGAPIHLVPVEALRALNSIDEMQGEFWPWREHWNGLWVVKETAAAAHIYGAKTVHMESFTGFRHWMDGPSDLKSSADRAFCEGMNHIVWHMAEHNPPEGGKPGWAYHAGSHFGVNLVWWEQMKPWIDYLSRTSHMLQQGLFVGDVVYYYGDKGANFIPPKHTNTNLNDGYDYDVTNLEVMLTRMDVKNGDIVLPDGMNYKVLVLPNQEDITVAALKRVKQLAEKGATVIGPKFTKSTGLYEADKNDSIVQKLVVEMWGNIDGVKVTENKVGEGRMISGESVNDVLAEMGVAYDFSYVGAGVNLDYIHRRTATQDIYFVRNEKNEKANFKATFRVQEKTPELWLPDTGEKIPVWAYNVSDKGITINMDLDKFGSVFVVFTEGTSDYLKSVKGNCRVVDVTENAVEIEAFKNEKLSIVANDSKTIEYDISTVPESENVAGEWNIEFVNKNWGAPESVKTIELKSLTEFEDKGINYYSGVSRYTNTVTVDASTLAEGNKVYLDLGDLWSTGDVTVNGQFVRNVWKAPYIIDITSHVKTGVNMLQIDIANTWCNRLAGDARNPNEKQYCRTNIDGKETTEADAFSKMKLRKSGLFGPVKLFYSTKVEVSK